MRSIKLGHDHGRVKVFTISAITNVAMQITIVTI